MDALFRAPLALLSIMTAALSLLTEPVTGQTQNPDAFVPVTNEILQDPSPNDWVNWRRTLDGWGYSPLSQINTANVHELQLVWAWQLDTGVSRPTPLVYGGLMFIPNPGNSVHALDATTGELVWQFTREPEDRSDPNDALNPAGRPARGSRSIAMYGRNIYLNTSDAHIVAIDAQTGRLAWDHEVADYTLGYTYTSGPIVANGNIVSGMTGCQNYKDDVCFISAHDPNTGDEVWRTSTIAQPGEPGGDSWGDLPLVFRAGGDSWIPGSYDQRTNLTYWSTSQAKPWARVSRKTDGDALYTNSVLALDATSGELAWYYQFTPGETHDLDDVFESVLIDRDGRRSLFKMGKLGILWELDRTTGEFIAAHDLGYQNVLDVDLQSGQVTYRPDMIPVADVELEFCPDLLGVRNWRASAYHPTTEALYIPTHPTCVTGMFTELEQNEGNNYYADRGFLQRESKPHPAMGDDRGQLIAMDIASGNIIWKHPMRTRPLAAALTMAGGLVVGADTDRNLYFHDAEDGEVLFQTRLPASVQGFPISYGVNGRQYVAAPVGGNRSNAVYVFALPEQLSDR
tara:strand:- start:1170 stop:2879 length:1710 start_codon:yes stop_codon:yes gene_type:complete